MTLVYDGTNYQKALGDTSGRTIVIEHSKQGHAANQVEASSNIYDYACVLYGLVVSGKGVTTGDTVVVSNTTAGDAVLTYVFGAQNETIVSMFPAPITFTTSVYAAITLATTSGTAYVTGIYDAT